MLANGDRVGDYIIEAELGGGGMATVYRARHAFLETVHALKVLAPEYRVQPEARTRFLDEAKLQAKHLDHPSIVKVTGIVATSEVAALVMELVDGPSLESWLADDAPLPLPLRLSTDLSLPQDATTAQQRAQALAQWKALNMTPEEVLQESARSAAQSQELALAQGQ